MANLLITGGAGFIGSTFVAQAVSRGHKAIVLDALTYAGHAGNVDKGATLVVGHLQNRELVAELLREYKIDALVNFAAESHVDNSIAGPRAFVDTNITGTFELLEAFRAYAANRKDVRFVQISTDEVYGSLGPTGKFTESSPIRPNSPYSASKAAADHLARAWFETYGLPTIITHCTNNYGPRQHPEKLIPHMITLALAGKPLTVYGDGRNVRDWIHVEDHCNGVWLALEKGTPGQVYDFGGNAESDNLSLVKTICALLDTKCPKNTGKYEEQIAFVTDRLGHDRRYAIDDSKAQKELGFTRKHKLESGLADTVDWYLAHQDWCAAMLAKPKP